MSLTRALSREQVKDSSLGKQILHSHVYVSFLFKHSLETMSKSCFIEGDKWNEKQNLCSNLSSGGAVLRVTSIAKKCQRLMLLWRKL